MQRDTDALYNVIWDDAAFDLAVRDGRPAKEYYVLFSIVEEEYRARWRDIHSTMFPDALSRDKYATPFAEAQLEVQTAQLLWNGVLRDDRYVFGIRRRVRQGAAGDAA